MLKLYRTLRKLEDRKYNGGHFAREIRQMISYFAAKHMMWDGADGTSVMSDNASRCSPTSGDKMSINLSPEILLEISNHTAEQMLWGFSDSIPKLLVCRH